MYKKVHIQKSFNEFILQVFDHEYRFHLVSDSQRQSFSLEITPKLTLGLSLGLGLGLAWSHFQDKNFFIYTSFKDFSQDASDDTSRLHLLSDSLRLSFSQELTPTLTLGLTLGLGLGLAWGHFQDKYFFVYTSFKDFSLNVSDDTNLLHLVSDSQRLSFARVLTPTLTLGLRLGLGLGLAWGHFQNKYFFDYTSFKYFSLIVHDDTNLLHLLSNSQRLSFSQELTPTLTLGLSFWLGLGLAWSHFQDKCFFIYTSFKDFSLDAYDDTSRLHLLSDSQRLWFSQELTPTLTLGLSLGLGLGLTCGHFQNKYFFVYTSFKDFSLNVYDDTNLLHLVSDSQHLSFSQELTPTLTLELSLGLGLGLA